MRSLCISTPLDSWEPVPNNVIAGRARPGMIVGAYVIARPRVLCVDDNRDTADTVAEVLSLSGYEAQACYDGAAALALADHFVPDICLIDFNMPGMDGDEVALRLRAAGHAPVLIAVTAMSNEESCRRIESAGFHLHLIKPVAPARLVELIERAGPPRQR